MLTKIFNDKVSAFILLIIGLTILYSASLITTLVIKLIAILIGIIISVVNALKLYLSFTAKCEDDEDPVYDRFGASFILIGAAISFGLLLTAFTWNNPKQIVATDCCITIDPTPTLVEFEPPITIQKKKKKQPKLVVHPPPPPELPQKIEVVDDNFDLTRKEEIITTSVIDIEDFIKDIPEPPEMPDLDDEDIKQIIEDDFDKPEEVIDEPPLLPINFAEVMPEFIGGEKALIDFVNDKLVYPRLAKDNGIEGLAVVNFVVNKDGGISDIEIVRDPGGGCAAELARVVSLMPFWKPGKQGGKNVSVRYTLPVRLKLEN